MKQDTIETNHWIAEEGKVIARKSDGFVMGKDIYLHKYVDGTEDVIDNYEEREVEQVTESDYEYE